MNLRLTSVWHLNPPFPQNRLCRRYTAGHPCDHVFNININWNSSNTISTSMFTWGVIRGVRTPVCYALSLQNKWKSFTTCRSSVYRVGKTLSFDSQKAINWDRDFAFKNFKFILHFCIYCILYVVYSMFWHAQCTPVQLLNILSLTPWNLDLDAFPVSFFIRHSFSKRRFEPCLHHTHRQELTIKACATLCMTSHEVFRSFHS